jgi:hypothetical protein
VSLPLILEVLLALLKFPNALRDFVRLLEKSDEQKRQEIQTQVQSWMKQSAESDRPQWEHP